MTKFWTLLVLLYGTSVLGQSHIIDERLFEWMESHSREQLVQRLALVRQQYQNSPIPLYLQAYLEVDGGRAAEIYQKIANQFSKSRYAEAAMIKLGEYFFVTRSYQRARFWFEKIIKSFPDSKFLPLAYFFSGVCSRLLDDRNLAKNSLSKFLEKFPDHQLADYAKQIISDLQKSERTEPLPIEPLETVLKRSDQWADSRYAVQIGAFRDRKNAIRLRERLASLDQPIEIVPSARGKEILYLVHVGKFISRDEATDYGNYLKKNYKLPFRVVKK